MADEEWSRGQEEAWRTSERLRWLGTLRAMGKRLGLDEQRLLDQLDRQRFACPICGKFFGKRPPHIDLDEENAPRGLLCGWCFKYIKAIEGDPLRSPKPHHHPRRKSRALVYLGFVTLHEP